MNSPTHKRVQLSPGQLRRLISYVVKPLFHSYVTNPRLSIRSARVVRAKLYLVDTTIWSRTRRGSPSLQAHSLNQHHDGDGA